MKLSRFQRRLVWVLVILVGLAALFNVEVWRVFNVNPQALKIEYESIQSEKMPSSMRDVSIVFLSDIEYGEFIHEGHLEEVFSRIRELNPDVLLFGGDLFSAEATADTPSAQKLVSLFSSIPAPLGKFAVYGEQDLISQTRKDMVNQVYRQAEVEVISNSSRLITSYGNTGFQLVGLDTEADPGAAFSIPTEADYVIVLSHYPDNLMDLEGRPVSLALAGNAHGTQITWPLIGGYREWVGSELLNRGHYEDLPFRYVLTSGIGCIEVNARFNATPAFTYFLID